MPTRMIGYRRFTDGKRRPVYQSSLGQFVINDDDDPVFGVWILDGDEDDNCDTPFFVHDESQDS